MDLFRPSLQRPALLEFAQALNSRPSALRRDECGDWRINGRGGHVYAVPGAFQVVVLCEKLEAGLAGRWTSQGWTYAKRALDFARLVNDGDDEGVFILDRLPSPAEAAILRRYCMIPKRMELGEEELARRRELAAVNLGGVRAKNSQLEDFRAETAR
jgi:hypothetical protein